MAAIKYWLWLSSETEVSPGSKAALIRHYGDPERAYRAPQGEFAAVQGVIKSDLEQLEARNLSRVEPILEACEEFGIDIITMQDAKYPQRLKNIAAAPPVLYVRGNLPEVDLNPAIAVIGTRNASPYGVKTARHFGTELSRGGAIIVSGLTAGVDISAAVGCLEANGVCIGVLGTAHDKEPREIEKSICSRGAVISEYPIGCKCYKSFFRDRNRITSALSVGVLAVEAPEKSGTLLFAEQALEQGREIFAVPGDIDKKSSAGTNRLIQDGAKLVLNAWDVLCEYEALYPGKLRQNRESFMPEVREQVETVKETPVKKTPKTVEKTVKPKEKETKNWEQQLSELNADQLKIIAAIERSASHVDDIVAETGLGAAKVLAQLTYLEIKRYIRREDGRKIVLNIAKK